MSVTAAPPFNKAESSPQSIQRVIYVFIVFYQPYYLAHRVCSLSYVLGTLFTAAFGRECSADQGMFQLYN